ncbi:VCBS repeat-containing protein [Actinoplanes bogorensis]|uniref:VCBS repeat-containing protein n=1 Tax=Paractinoplanes bogorensis TaxID=1610840 RepID=A0ABS5YXQ6_9ACTN|nr:GDSL-type esterase/lipase family protein [Actinoplanes bogorensis]MBU2668212.1 VCBS repeat-containing protein [Actinoplanes bogorensis]
MLRKALAGLLPALVVVLGLSVTRPALANDFTACGLVDSTTVFEVPSDTPAGEVTMRVGCAKQAGAFRGLAASDNDVIFQIWGHGTGAYADAFHDTMQKLTDDFGAAQQRGTSLSEFLDASFRIDDPVLTPGGGATPLEFDGKLATVGSVLAVVVPAGEVQANANWWQKMVATIGGTAIGIIIGGLCALAVPVLPALAPVCGALGGFFGGLFVDLFNSMFDGRPLGDKDVWVEAITQGLLGAGLGAAGGAVATWAERNAMPIFTGLQHFLKNSYRALLAWLHSGSGTLTALAYMETELEEFVPALVARLRRAVVETNASVRLMPLGDSITAGQESSDNNGYRDELYDAIDALGTVDFVGSARNGTMADPDHEGHPGWRIDQIDTLADCTVEQYQPNVVTLMAGTNDINQNYDLAAAPQRLKNLINQVLADSPKAAVIVAKLLPTGKAGLQPRIDVYNPAIYRVVADLKAEGKHVVWADTSDITVSEGLQNDSHPNDAGYAKLGAAFYRGFQEVISRNWLQAPAAPKKCQSGSGDDGTTALGAGWRKLGVIAPGMGRPATYDRTELAEMNGDARQDYVQIRKDGSIRVGINTPDQPGQPTWPNWLGGTGEFLPAGGRAMVPVDPDAETVADQMRLADIDGDGRDDVVFVAGNGRMDAYMNLALTETSPPGWTKLENFGPFTGTVNRANIRFADVNGDGRDDVLRVGSDGEVHAYYNFDPDNGVLLPKPRWVEKLSWAPGVNGASLANLRFADVNGDRRADYLMVGTDGSVHAYLNKGGKDAGGFEAHLKWANASNYPQKYVQFKDISGDGKADYLVVYAEGAVRAWLNRGGNL